MLNTNVLVPRHEIEAFCRRHKIRKLSLFGSVVRADFGPESDIDVVVEFADSQRAGFIALAGMQAELSVLFERPVDLHTPGSLSPKFRERVLAEAEALYVAP